eukprot:3940650-Rhodomonas_salina.3
MLQRRHRGLIAAAPITDDKAIQNATGSGEFGCSDLWGRAARGVEVLVIRSSNGGADNRDGYAAGWDVIAPRSVRPARCAVSVCLGAHAEGGLCPVREKEGVVSELRILPIPVLKPTLVLMPRSKC